MKQGKNKINPITSISLISVVFLILITFSCSSNNPETFLEEQQVLDHLNPLILTPNECFFDPKGRLKCVEDESRSSEATDLNA